MAAISGPPLCCGLLLLLPPASPSATRPPSALRMRSRALPPRCADPPPHKRLLRAPNPPNFSDFAGLSSQPPARSAGGLGGAGLGRVRAGSAPSGDSPSFLSVEEAGLVELAALDMHERFLCRLTVSSLNLLRVISEQEGVAIEELNAGKLCDWFQKDKAKREQDRESATLKWETGSGW